MSSESDAQPEPRVATAGRFTCRRCAAELTYKPGTTVLRCDYCGNENEITPGAADEETAEAGELDYVEHLQALEEAAPADTVTLIKCDACGAEIDLPANLDAFPCPFCRADMVAPATEVRLLRPRSMLPFAIDREAAQTLFRSWIGGRWFAPSDLKRFARSGGRLDGLYLPYWTYDSGTISDYHGQRGDNYTTTETYTTVENGKSVVKQRQVVRTNWTSVSGQVAVAFDDVLVCASRSLPADQTKQLEDWDLGALVPFQPEYLAGFRAEKYQVGLPAGFEAARALMRGPIESAIAGDIGGDHQRIDDMETHHHDITFKHLLVPVWISAYRYRGKVYRFVVNGQTGRLYGERPYSRWKIVLLALAAVVGILILVAIIAAAS